MNYLLDTNICSAFMRGDRRVFNRFIQHSGGLATSAIVVGELHSWVHRKRSNPGLVHALMDLIAEMHVLPVDYAVAERFGRIRSALLDSGRPLPEIDLLIGATAVVHDLTLVTHNAKDFSGIDDLRIEDWILD